MSKAKSTQKEKEKKQEKKQDISYAIHDFGLQKDKIWKMCTLTFPKSTDRGLEIETSNFNLKFRMRKEDYYSLADMLFGEVYDEFQESDSYNALIDDFREFLSAKITGEE